MFFLNNFWLQSTAIDKLSWVIDDQHLSYCYLHEKYTNDLQRINCPKSQSSYKSQNNSKTTC